MTDLAALGLTVRSDGLVVATDKLEDFERASGDAAKGGEKFEKSSDKLQKGLRRLASVVAPLVATLASGALFTSAVVEAQKFETSMFRVEAIIRATNGVAQRSADDLREQARQIAFSTLESTEGILRAQQTLLTFRNVQGDVFDRTIKAATDMTAALGGDLNSATLQLAKALEDPVTGMTALTRSGTVFTTEQKEMVKAMVEVGDLAEAQAFILSELEAQYGGTAEAAAGGLAGAQDTLGQALQEAKLALADQLGLLEAATAINNTLADAVIALTDVLPVMIDGLKAIGVALVALAATQIPAVIAGIGLKVTALTAGTTAMGLMTVAAGVLRTALAFLGGPLGIAAGVATAFGLLVVNVDKTSRAMRDSPAAIDPVTASILAVGNAADGTAGHMKTLEESTTKSKNAFDDWLAAFEDLPPGIKQQLGLDSFSTNNVIPGQPASGADIEDYLASLEDTPLPPSGGPRRNGPRRTRTTGGGGGGGGAARAVDELTLAQKRALAVIGQMNEEAVTQQDVIGALDELYRTGAISADQLADATERVREEMRDTNAAAFDLGSSLAGVFTDAVTGAKNLQDGLRGLLQQMSQLFLNQAFTQLLSGAGGGGGLLSSIFGGFRADGGPVASGRAYVVGERGPELFMPGRSGTIIPNAPAQSGSGTVVQVVNNSGQPSRQERSRGPDGREIVRVIVGEEIGGGGFDKQLGGRYGNRPVPVRR